MKITSWILCLGLMSSVHAGVRNPFIMPRSLCEETLKQLDGWRLQGVIASSARTIALMNGSQQHLLRVIPGTVLMAGVKVMVVSLDRVSVSLSEICDESYYHWHLSGEKND